MKILFFVDSLRAGGKERRIVELVKGLSKSKKHEIQFVLTKRTIHYGRNTFNEYKNTFCRENDVQEGSESFF